uniref:Uncharacterized protein n=1 Tax=Schistocephalus solidus TaxID=70667 RepID=A0A183SCV1_SCHSO
LLKYANAQLTSTFRSTTINWPRSRTRLIISWLPASAAVNPIPVKIGQKTKVSGPTWQGSV